MARFDLQFLGAEELEHQLRTLPERVERKVVTFALRRAAREVLIPMMRAELRQIRATGELSDRIAQTLRYRMSRKRRRHAVRGFITPGTKAELGIETVTLRDGTVQDNIYFAPAHIEFGTARSQPRPFMRNALRNGRSSAFDAMRRVIGQKIEQEAQRMST